MFKRRHPFPIGAKFEALCRHIEGEIRRLEQGTCGELRVVIHLKKIADLGKKPLDRVYEIARLKFAELGMTQTEDRSGVLLFIAGQDRLFAIVGDEGIDAKVLRDGWLEVAKKMGENFRKGRFEQGFSEAISHLAEVLKEHYPIKPGDKNEITNAVIVERIESGSPDTVSRAARWPLCL